LPAWCWSRYVRRGHKWCKPPRSPFAGSAYLDDTDPAGWGPFCRVLEMYNYLRDHGNHPADFIGKLIQAEYNLLVLDLDNCIIDGAVTPWALELLDHLKGRYVEYSPSGHGLHVFCRNIPGLVLDRKEKFPGGAVEVFSTQGYVTVTGVQLDDDFHPDDDLPEATPEAVAWLIETYFPERPNVTCSTTTSAGRSDVEVLDYMRRENPRQYELLISGNWKKYGKESQSEADAAAVESLWTFSRDRDQVERLFMKSPLADRPKAREREDYFGRTFDFVLRTGGGR
jgi:putative DNA primase/helicase